MGKYSICIDLSSNKPSMTWCTCTTLSGFNDTSTSRSLHSWVVMDYESNLIIWGYSTTIEAIPSGHHVLDLSLIIDTTKSYFRTQLKSMYTRLCLSQEITRLLTLIPFIGKINIWPWSILEDSLCNMLRDTRTRSINCSCSLYHCKERYTHIIHLS